jgi:hypothetical protein
MWLQYHLSYSSKQKKTGSKNKIFIYTIQFILMNIASGQSNTIYVKHPCLYKTGFINRLGVQER